MGCLLASVVVTMCGRSVWASALMMENWRTGFGVSARAAVVAPVASLIVAGLGMVLCGGDILDGFFPWAMTLAALGLVICAK